MSEANVMVSFHLDRDTPVRFRWLATDGVPGDGYKAQITAIVLADGTRLAMDDSSILEQPQPDPSGGANAYMLSFTGMVGYAADHADRRHIDKLADTDVDYELAFVHDDGHVASVGQDYQIIVQPRAVAGKLTKHDA
jgi:hypothetical protein